MNTWHSMGGWGWAAMGFAVVFAIALFSLVASLVAAPARGRDDRNAAPESAREILDRRLASGELDLESYQRTAEALGTRRLPSER